MFCHDGGELGKCVEESIAKRFPFGTWMKVHEQPGLMYCGKEIKVVQKDGETCVTLAQKAFTDGRLQPMKVEASRTKQPDARTNQAEMNDFRSIVGSLQWLAVQPRPGLLSSATNSSSGCRIFASPIYFEPTGLFAGRLEIGPS